MEWEEFYEAFSCGEDILDQFVFLESYSSSDEVLEVAEALEDKDHRIAFLMSAHRWGTVFEPEDYVELFYYLDDEKLRDYILINSDMEYTKDELELIEGYVSDEALEFVAEKNGFTYFDESPFAKYVDDFNENIEIKQKHIQYKRRNLDLEAFERFTWWCCSSRRNIPWCNLPKCKRKEYTTGM